MSLRDIARQTGSSVATVYRWIRRWQHEGHINTRTKIYRSFERFPHYFVSKTEADISENIDSFTDPRISTIAYSINKPEQTLQTPNSLSRSESITPQLTYEYSKYMPLHSEQEVDNLRVLLYLCQCEWNTRSTYF